MYQIIHGHMYSETSLTQTPIARYSRKFEMQLNTLNLLNFQILERISEFVALIYIKVYIIGLP